MTRLKNMRIHRISSRKKAKKRPNFQPNARVVENKNRKFLIFFIACPAGTYVKNAAYIFVDFRIKTACSSNYGGRLFFASGKNK
jgi:hypothetical protein